MIPFLRFRNVGLTENHYFATIGLSVTTIIEIKQWRNGWKVFECPGVEPVFPVKDQALSYARGRASFRSGISAEIVSLSIS